MEKTKENIGNSTEYMMVWKVRFEANMQRHPTLLWDEVEKRIQADKEVFKSLQWMEDTLGEPDLIRLQDDEYYFVDLSAQTPAGRYSHCYDEEARLKRKKNAPEKSAWGEAEKFRVQIINEEDYYFIQEIEELDTKTSSWIDTNPKVRSLGGALFGDRRYNRVFIYHNGADSYYSGRAFRTKLKF